MSFFDTDFTKAERDAMIAARKTVQDKINNAAGIAWTTAQLDDLARLNLGNARINIDDAQFTADDREYSRSFNADGVPNAPEYRHEFLMGQDGNYHAAWSYDFAEVYRSRADLDPSIMQTVERGRVLHPYREMDPGIVDRSLLRHGYRVPREGEGDPPPVVGKYAPKLTAVLPSVRRPRILSPLS